MQKNQESPKNLLKGFSGCRLEVRRSKGSALVCKTAGTPAQNDKLAAEVEKLRLLARLGSDTGLFSVPSVFDGGVNRQGLGFYEIEFIPGWELDARLPQMTPREIDDMALRLHEIISAFAATPGEEPGPGRAAAFLRGKFRETREAVDGARAEHPEARPLIEEYADRIGRLRIPAGTGGGGTFCHGDLALDNVLVGRNGRIYLIDPLINGCESHLWDISKVFQSSLIRWRHIKHGEFEVDCARRKIHLRSSMRVAFFNVRFASLALESNDPGTVLLYLAATVARAAKYWKTPEQLCVLLMVTNELLDRYDRKEYDLDESLDSMRW